MTEKNNPGENTADQEIISTRAFPVPRGRLFQAFSDPARLARWWGPEGFTNTFQEFDFRPGGRWRFTMRGPDGVTYDNETSFLEVVKPERIVLEHLEPIHRFQMAMAYTEEDGATRLTWRMRFESAAECAKVKDFVAKANEQNFDRLEAVLAQTN